ncbi:hypothetical protein ED733_001002 [Metarhizium rileyi]|uniref:Uncharacterized protein n=1 Tax=Metarhizium rileyi (strain RCEF 4871) TaxID=1649241 RepID=A0A5C6G4Y5_METRR|nr:hypothetical protein ED733_001002 [Metarhizium rileyi]
MSSRQNGADIRSITPPKQQKSLPPTPPTTDKRPGHGIETVEDLRRYWASRSSSNVDDADEIVQIPVAPEFNPHDYENDIQAIFPRFDCCATYRQGCRLPDRKILVRMPSRIHEGFIADIEKESYRQLGEINSNRLNIEIEAVPRIVVEVAYTQPGSHGKRIATDYVSGTDGQVKRVFFFDLNPIGKASTLSEWRTKITPSDDPTYEGDLSIEAVMMKEFRAADGSQANVEESLKIPYGDFDTGADPQGHVICIGFPYLYDILTKLEKKRPQQDPGHAEPGSKRFRFRRSPSTSVEQLLSEHEREFQKAEDIDDDGSDFIPGTDESQLGSDIET